MQNGKVKNEYGAARYFLLTVLLSFLGWAFETVVLLIATWEFHDRGFMILPLCPIYGCSLLFVYFLLGTPDEGTGLLSKVQKDKTRYVFYLLFAFLIPSAMEFFVGLFFDRALQIRLWDYSWRKYNLFGYVCLRNSVIWSVLIFLFMKYLFLPIKNLIKRIPDGGVQALAFTLLLLTLADICLCFGRVLY